MYSLLKTVHVLQQAVDPVYDSNKGPSPSNKMTPPPPTSNVNVKYHDQWRFTCVSTMLPYPNGQT